MRHIIADMSTGMRTRLSFVITADGLIGNR